jgi:hypothetical protein
MALVSDVISDLETCCSMFGETIDRLRELEAQGINQLETASGTVANFPSGARDAHALLREQPLPRGRLKREPYKRQTSEESRAEAWRLVSATSGWIIPMEYACQHYDTDEKRQYYKGLLVRWCKVFVAEGLMERRSMARPGSRLEYRLAGAGAGALRLIA